MNLASTQGTIFGYSGLPGNGTLYFSLAPVGGNDTFGNSYPTGIYAQSGQLLGTSLVGASLDSTSTLMGSNIQGASILAPTVQGGTAASLVHTMSNGSGAVLGYTTATGTVQTWSTAGTYQWTAPTGISQIRVQTWGPGAGGGGGGTSGAGGGINEGGEAGGGGEYAEEPSYAVVPGGIYNIVVGGGGNGGSTGNGGGNGQSATQFYPQSTGLTVQANPGLAGVNFTGGAGGSGSTNTIHFDGGDGGNADGNLGAAGAGSSGDAAGEGNPGNTASGSTGGSGGTAPGTGGAGGTGGNAASNGVDGSGPGGGGGGAGFVGAATVTKTYAATGSRSYYGADAGSAANKTKTVNGTVYCGGYQAAASNGTQKCILTFNQAQMASDFTGYTMTDSQFIITDETTIDPGATLQLKYYTATGGAPATFNGNSNTVVIGYVDIGKGQRHLYDLGASLAAKFQSGVAHGITIGPGPYPLDKGWYAQLNGAPNNSSSGPVLKLTGSLASPESAGDGADGKVAISYSSATAPTFALSVSATQGTDTFGNPFQQGFQGPQLTLTGSQAPSTVPTGTSVNSSVALTSNNNGTPIATNTSGFTGLMPSNLTSVTRFTVTSTSSSPLGNSFTIQGGDAEVGTIYRLTTWGHGTISSGSPNFIFAANLAGGDIVQKTYSFFGFNSYNWKAVTDLLVVATGISGTVETAQHVMVWAQNQTANTSTFPVFGYYSGSAAGGAGSPVTLNTSAGGNFNMQGAWSASGGSIWSVGSLLERLGP